MHCSITPHPGRSVLCPFPFKRPNLKTTNCGRNLEMTLLIDLINISRKSYRRSYLFMSHSASLESIFEAACLFSKHICIDNFTVQVQFFHFSTSFQFDPGINLLHLRLENKLFVFSLQNSWIKNCQRFSSVQPSLDYQNRKQTHKKTSHIFLSFTFFLVFFIQSKSETFAEDEKPHR